MNQRRVDGDAFAHTPARRGSGVIAKCRPIERPDLALAPGAASPEVRAVASDAVELQPVVAIATHVQALCLTLSRWVSLRDHSPLVCTDEAALEDAAARFSTALVVVEHGFGPDALALCERVSRVFRPARFMLFLACQAAPAERDVFGAGADDYVRDALCNTSVFERAGRLLSRARATRGIATTRLRCAAIDIDFTSQVASVAGEPVQLTSSELRVLAYLLLRPNQFIPASVLQVAALGGRGTSVYEHVSNLLGKLGVAASLFKHVRGKGYVFAGDERTFQWLPAAHETT